MIKTIDVDTDIEELRRQLHGSFLMFITAFFPIVTGREFVVSQPIGRESHIITCARVLTKVMRGELLDTLINVPPGYGKSTIMSFFTAWVMSRYPDSNFIYVSYSKVLAAKHTEFIKRIMQTDEYEIIFGVSIRKDSRAKDFFQTTHNGSVKAFGSQGAITGQDAGLPNVDHLSGAVIMDDMHKPDEVHSDTIRESVIQNYKETIIQRPRGPNVPIICIGQRLHEQDICAHLLSDESERVFTPIVLKALDGAGNSLNPDINPVEMLLEKQAKSQYVFASQFQQDPVPSGGAIFKEKDFLYIDDEPEFVCTFLTVDTAETDKTYNDATVFTFWGLYKINDLGYETGGYALHCINCIEIWVEPKELEGSFMEFYTTCMRHPVKPMLAAIEKKSTGVTLLSTLENIRGLKLREVKRTKASGSKTTRFLEMQPYIAAKLITFTVGARHAKKCVTHMGKITANDTHANDDICDTFYDAVKIALIDKTLYLGEDSANDVVKQMADRARAKQKRISEARYG